MISPSDRCYGHNRPLRECPTRVRCLYRKLVSALGWSLIHHAIARK